MKRSFDIDKAMEVSNVGEYEGNEIHLKVCNQTIRIDFRKKDMKLAQPFFTVRSNNYYDRLAVDPFTHGGELVAMEPAEIHHVTVALKSDAIVEAESKEQKSECCTFCGGCGVVFANDHAQECFHCLKFKSASEARKFVRKVFETVIGNGGGE